MSGGDAGLQRERTRLAWRRTCLAVVLGGVVSFRFLPPLLGGVSGLTVACAVLVAGAVLTVGAEVRGRRLQRTALDGSQVLPGAGTATLLLTVTISLAAVVAAVPALGDV